MWWNDCYVIGEYKYFHEFGSKLELILFGFEIMLLCLRKNYFIYLF